MNLMEKRQKNTNLKRQKIIIKKLKKQVRGITLIALVVTIIVLLILAGVALSLTVGNNGLFRRAENAANTWQMAEQNEQSEMEQAGEFIDDYANNITRVDGVPIPNGFYYVGGEENTGLIISDSDEDANKGDNLEASEYVGNQFVWVPVEHPENYFIDETVTLNTNATGTEEENEVTTNVYSNLTIRSGDSHTAGAPGVEETEEGNYVTREPDVLSLYDTNARYYDNILGFNSTKDMADSFVKEYKAMSDSIKKYNGFYIGRYELTGTVEAPTEKAGEVLSAAKAGNWYNLYKACQNVVTEKNNVKSTMIYGVQWDATMDWITATKFQGDRSKVDEDSSSWGNYNDSSGNADVEGAGLVQNTGYSDYWKANNIYDLAGNCWEWTQEAYSTNVRIRRGGSYPSSGSNAPASYRGSSSPFGSDSNLSSRATLYMP